MTPRMIAYVAVQVRCHLFSRSRPLIVDPPQLRFALTSKSTWSIRDGPFDYQKFYCNILSIFEADPDAGQEIIDHYN